MNNNNSLLGIFQVLWKWKWYIIGLSFLTGVISIIASLQLPNYYQATTTFIPASQEVFKPEAVFSGEGVKYLYGGRDDVDRMIAISESPEVRNFLIDSFRLYEVYDIDPEHPKGKIKVYQELNELIKVLKTKYNAIELHVEDTDPDRAAAMANVARDRSAHVIEFMMVSRLRDLQGVMEEDNDKRSEYRDALNDSLMIWRDRYGIINYESQSEVLAELITVTESNLQKKSAQLRSLQGNPLIPRDTIAIMRAEIAGLSEQLKSITSSDSKSSISIPKLSEGKQKVSSAQQRLDIETNHINYQGMRIQQYKTNIKNGFNALFTIQEATAPYEKSRPRRSRVVMGAVFLAFILSVLGILLIDRFQEFDWKENFK